MSDKDPDWIAGERAPVDLHLHTWYSDGDDGPEQVVARCKEAGLRVVSCTDHDTISGLKAFQAAVEHADMEFVPGCEVTAVQDGCDVHCLVYFFDPDDEQFRQRTGSVLQAELEWWGTWFDQAEQLGVPVSRSAMRERFGAERIAYFGDYLDFFLDAADNDTRFQDYPRGRYEALIQDWCRAGRPLHVPHPWRPSPAEVAQWAADAGGVAVLAHPARSLPGDDSTAALTAFKDVGFTGLEVWTTWHSPADSERLGAACAAAGLIGTQGSDYHGPRLKPWAPAPGLVPVACPDPWAMLEALDDARPTGRPHA